MVSKRLIRATKLYFSSIIVYGLALILYRIIPFYQEYLGAATQKTLIHIFIAYIVLSPFYYLKFCQEDSENKQYILLSSVWGLVHQIKSHTLRITKKQKVAFLFIIVKFFFLPLMIQFFHGNFSALISKIVNHDFYWYAFALTFIFMLDTLIFGVGYTFEFKSLGNVVKSVEPTFFGWFVAIICYPPFNIMTGKYVPWGAQDYVLFWNPTITFIMRVLLILLLIIYVWASVALGPKASNLTNRGIVDKFPYSIIRHPAYISKMGVWWLTLLPVLNVKFALGMLFWTVIYYFRSITEENHLKQDPDYVAYCKKVKYRFIPGIY